jgi:hypothetical protein
VPVFDATCGAFIPILRLSADGRQSTDAADVLEKMMTIRQKLESAALGWIVVVGLLVSVAIAKSLAG